MTVTTGRLVALAILCCAATAQGQSGPRTGGPAPTDVSTTRLAAELSLGGDLARGNTDRDLVTARGSVTIWDGPWGVFVQPYWLYGDVANHNTDDERYLRTLIFRALAKPIFAYGAAVYDQSLRRRIDRRGLFGGGFGATIWDDPQTTVVVSAGLLDEVATYGANTLMDGTIISRETRRVARASMRLYGRYKLFHGKLALVHDAYLLPAVRDLDDLRALVSGAIDVPLVGGLAARVQLDGSYEQHVVPGTQHDDIELTFGLAFRGSWTR
jgi:hypothetical protein